MFTDLDIKDLTTEYINDYSPSLNLSLTKTACAFLNTKGGHIIVYVRPHGEESTNAEEIADSILSYLREQIEIKNGNISDCVKISRIVDNKGFDGNAMIFFKIPMIYQKSTYACIKNGKTQKEEVYIRVGENNQLTNISNLPYARLASQNVFPVIKDYSPQLAIEKEELKKVKIKRDVELKTIGILSNDKSNRIFKYMDLEAALLSLTNGNIRFYEPSNWEDDYECRFYNANYTENGIPIDKEKAPFLYATCMASAKNNEAAWVLYSHKQTGLASRCVQFELNLKKFRKQLIANLKNSSIYIGAVKYTSTFLINHLHEPVVHKKMNRHYHLYFDSFSLEFYLNLLLLKRTDFEHENEVRVFIIPNSKNKDSKKDKTRKTVKKTYVGNDKPQHIDIKIDWYEIIEGVRLSEDCTDYEKGLLQDKLDKLYANKMRRNKRSKSASLSVINRVIVDKFSPYKDENLSDTPLDISVN